MSRSVWIEKSTERKYKGLKNSDRERLKEYLTEVSELQAPSEHPKVKLLEGPQETVYRLRVGNYRVVFTTEYGKLKVWKLGRRKDIYDSINTTYDKIQA